MSYNYIELISLVLLALGCFFILSGSLGLIKLPDVFSRIHAAGLIDTQSIDSTIFGTGKFYKEKQEKKKENIYSDIDEMLNSTLKNDDDN